MKKNISITLTLIIFSIIKLIAQPCNTGVAARSPMFGVPPGGISQATITAQSFTANCSGILSSITFTFDLWSDDFRSTGDFIKCNFKTASGVLLGKGVMPNGKDTTDKIFPTGSLTVNFSCIPIVSGTQYIWELEDVSNVSPPNQFVFLLSKRTATAPDYAGGNMILDGVPTATTDLQGWKVNIATGNPVLTAIQSQTNASCGVCADGTASVLASGGTGSYTYSWSPSGGTTAIASGLLPNTYTCTIKSCEQTITKTFTISGCSSISSSISSQTNIACNGANNGAATILASGGSGFTYTWSPSGGNSATASGLSAGTYSCNITNSCGSIKTQTVLITQPTALTTASAVTNVLCNGASTGAATITASGGTAGYTYLWSTGATTSVITSQPVGVKTVTVTDANGCTTTSNATITQPASAVSSSNVVTNILCFGASTGAINLTPAGGTSPYTFNWGGGITTEDRTGLLAGAYNCTVTDNNGCTTNSNATITQPASAVSASNVVTNVLCFGASSGAINLTPSGGTAPYTFNWGGGIITEDRTGLLAGTYNCTVTDNNGCTTTSNATITQPASALVATISSTNTACLSNTGIASVIASGGTPSYSYAWSPSGGTASTTTGLGAGTYSCIITDINSCTITKTVSVNTASAPSLTSAAQTNISCFGGSNGAASVNTATGGSAPYTYNWTPGNPTGDGTTSVTGLTAQIYTCTVTDANGCSASQTFNISQPASALATSTAVSNVACFGNSTGSATVTATGGTASYSYLWSTGATTSVITSQASGTKSYTVTDANGCTSSGNAIISQPLSALTTSTTVTNVLCNGGSTGSATITATGGTSAYSYLWSTGATTSVITSQTAGVKTATVTDANGCSSIKSVSITQPVTALSASNVVTNVLCFGNSTGAINLTPAGGTSAYTFNWGGGITTEDRTGLLAGAYTCTITDANGCTTTSNATVTQPASAIAATISSTNTACLSNTGIASVIASGGTPSYSYAWSPSGGTAATATGLGAGTYSCVISDANSCSITKTVSVNTASGPSLTSAAQTNISCFGGSNGAASVNAATGGTTPYTYNWTPGNPTGDGTTSVTGLTAQVYNCTVTDANGCSASQTFNVTQPASALATSTAVTNVLCFGNSTGAATITASGGTTAYTYLWSTGATTSVITSQTAGVKTATVTDANGCSSIKSVSISQPASALATSTTVANVACFGNSTGSATITATGGTTSYSYLWSTGATTSVITSQASGTKSYTVTDANGCSSTGNAIISQPSSALATFTTVTNVLCNGGSNGSATVTAIGGTTSYSYLWSTGATTSVITSQAAGVKTATVTDANGCTSVNSVSILEPTLLTATTTQTNTTCNGVCDGSAIVTPDGGTAPYTFNWSNGSTSSTNNALCAGVYTVTVTDANGCTINQIITITEPTAINVSALSGNILCNGGSTSVTVTANGGTGAYTGIGSFTQTAGTYTYIVTDANACSTNTVITITEPTALNVSLSAAPITCNGSTTQVTFNVSGGTTPYSGNSPVTVSVGSYTYIVTDANNCSVTETITVTQPTAIVASQTITLCNGQSLSIGSNTYTTSGTYVDVLQSQVNGCDSTLTTELTILPAITHTQNITLCFGEVLSVGSNIYNASGTYTDVLTASNGCDSTLTTVLVINPAIDVTTSLSGLTISANESAATYQWIDCDNSNQPISGETNQSFTASSNGNYAVIVTQNNCSDTSACVNISTVGIKDVSKSNIVTIYPNPSNGIYNMTGLTINSKITVYDAIGQIVYTSTTTESKETIDISNLPNGVYVIQLNSGNSSTTKKVIKKD